MSRYLNKESLQKREYFANKIFANKNNFYVCFNEICAHINER